MENVQVLFEDNHLIAVNKPAGWLVQGDSTGDHTLGDWVKAYIKQRYNKPGDVFLGTIHRLDRPVSGVVVFARTSKGLTRMNELFRDRKIQKQYWAVVTQRPYPENGHLTHYILKDKTKNIAKAYHQKGRRTQDAKKADLDYELLGYMDGHALLNVKLITGRPHQIRVQLASIGCPIKCDMKYGHKTPSDKGAIYLHCRSLSFIHPVKKEPVSIQAAPPDDYYWNMYEGLVGGFE